MTEEKPTLYLILFRADREVITNVGSLGNVVLTPGYYVYAGSAKKNMTARLKRHRKREKRSRWHIDYLRPHLTWQGSFRLYDQEGECALVKALCSFTGAAAVHNRLGSSDCRCKAHFLKLPEKKPAHWNLAGFTERWNALGQKAFVTDNHD